MTEKDYSLLRPFDLEAAKAGVLLCDQSGSALAGLLCCTPDSSGYFRAWVDRIGGLVSSLPGKSIRLAPLCWVEGKPVYPGDVLERANGKAFIPDMVAISGELRMCGEGLPSFLKPELLRWPRPKPVKRWINVYPNTGYDTKAEADQVAAIGRIDCIEIELPPLKP